jgi:NAD(P)H-hydrate repair Nnr-like enzyme with NAD(P)H-hydrate dehydratase domain
VLKGAISTIATENKVYVSTRGTPAMAKGGVGDVLSGILSAFLSKMSIPKALKLGVFLHGIAGEITTSKSHLEAFSTIDMIKHVSEAFRYIENAKDDEVSYRLHIENMQDV